MSIFAFWWLFKVGMFGFGFTKKIYEDDNAWILEN